MPHFVQDSNCLSQTRKNAALDLELAHNKLQHITMLKSLLKLNSICWNNNTFWFLEAEVLQSETCTIKIVYWACLWDCLGTLFKAIILTMRPGNIFQNWNFQWMESEVWYLLNQRESQAGSMFEMKSFQSHSEPYWIYRVDTRVATAVDCRLTVFWLRLVCTKTSTVNSIS